MQGLGMTLLLAFLAVAMGSVLALIPALMRLSPYKALRVPATFYVEIIRGTPMLVQVLLIYQLLNIPLLLIGGIDMGSFVPGLVALLINSSAYISEIIRGGILAVDKGQGEAARSLGLSESQTMRHIILPQAIKQIFPALGNEFVTIIKETSIFMYLGIAELMYQIGILKASSPAVTELYITAGILYLILTYPLSKLMNFIERRLRHADAK
ncbi:MAG TPA: arginine ABC transporter permease [Acholeplasmataceae bacterium]|nr:arginine ABC transporter permease [Acholeplasmataceae bacterium]HBO67442.1 arginine ABC transporter permease [Acholeplasmataceae bacterium]HBS00435.1 arginine ABC transporter permease [Acholeplasmataceae bacterium]HCB20675.1 arginine ABC transporter permease [Acholeplasmataceae bacterium]HCZ23390.1 arginine ABC transporter permease [Acholeplasmataceae bacterium]